MHRDAEQRRTASALPLQVFFEDDTKLQSSWSYWEVADNKSIIGVSILDSDMYVIVQCSDGVYLEKTSLRAENVDSGTNFEILLDRKVTEAECTVALTNASGLDLESTITLPYPIANANNTVVVGRYAVGNTLNHGNVILPTSETLTGGAGAMAPWLCAAI